MAFYKYFRTPKTKNEKSQWDEDKEFVRAKRRASNLPDAWTDLRYSKRKDKSWKVRTKKRFQHKIKGE